MLEQIEQYKIKKEDAAEELENLKKEITMLENTLKASKIPAIISFDGWSAAGKGSLIAKLIKNLDPRFFHVESIGAPSVSEIRKPWLWRYWVKIPPKGEFLILDRSWYRDTVNAYMYGEINKDEMKMRLDDINTFERQLADDGYLIIKFFVHIGENEQKERIKKLNESDITKWRIDKHDLKNLNEYEKFYKLYNKMLEKTNTKSASWHIIPANEKTTAELFMLKTVTSSIKNAVVSKENGKRFYEKPQFPIAEYIPEKFELLSAKKLNEIDMNKSISDEEYDKKLEKYQNRLFELQNLCYQKKIPVIICYEGWDAAGKGGNIKRVAAALDPRGYEVKPIAAPEQYELARHYLYRFWTRLENDGHFTIFDRTWYGRVMVESIEKLAPENRVEMAYNEINEFEKMLTDWGAVVIKFWINITNDEQLKRFKLRQETREKQWKITDEDWRNREKWDDYEKAVNKMLSLTSTEKCPWTVIEGTDKKYARIIALKTIVKRVSKKLEDID